MIRLSVVIANYVLVAARWFNGPRVVRRDSASAALASSLHLGGISSTACCEGRPGNASSGNRCGPKSLARRARERSGRSSSSAPSPNFENTRSVDASLRLKSGLSACCAIARRSGSTEVLAVEFSDAPEDPQAARSVQQKIKPVVRMLTSPNSLSES